MDYNVVGMELLKGFGLFFLHPLFYIILVFSVFLGYKRVKRERRNFHTRVYDVVDDLISPLVPGIIAGLLLSVVMVSLGIVIPMGMVVLFSFVYAVTILTGQVRWLSPAYTASLTLLVALIFPKFETGTVIIDRWMTEIHDAPLGGIAILISLLLIMEAALIIKNGSKHTSPRLLKGKRGKIIGVHEARKIWILPLLVLLPAGNVPVVDFWPVIPTDSSQIGFIFVPFFIGFQQVISSTLPVNAIKNYGKRVLFIAFFVTGLAITGLYVPIMIPIVAVVALLARELLAFFQKLHEENDINMYTQRENGLVILGVIPQSPAEKLNLKIGEIITRVNEIPVKTDQQFYEALQKNSAFCKFEIIDENGELRFGQTALYEDKHYQVGLLFVQENKNEMNEDEVG